MAQSCTWELLTMANLNTTSVFEQNAWAYRQGYKIIVNQGGTSCFAGDQLVITATGNTPISKLSYGDMVKTKNLKTGLDEWKSVKNVFKYSNTKPTIKLKLKNGKSIVATDDHKFYFKGGWYSIKHIVSLWHENNMEKNTKI